MSISDQIKAMQRAVIANLGDGDENITLSTYTPKGVLLATYNDIPCLVSAYTADDFTDDKTRDLQTTKYFRFQNPTGASPKRGDKIIHNGETWTILGAASGHGDCFKWRAALDKVLGIGDDKVKR